MIKKNNPVIDLLRFFASFTVFMFHQNEPIPRVDNWYRNIVKYGHLGVPVFFVISGYCVMMSGSRSGNAIDFLCRRFFRIFPTYWLSIFVVLLAAVFQLLYTGTNSVQHLPKNGTELVASIFLFTYPLTKIGTMNWVYWTLTCELFFYVLVGLAIWSRRFESGVLLLVSLLTCLLPWRPTGVLFLLSQWPAFGIGVSLFLLSGAQPAGRKITGAVIFLTNTTILFVHAGAGLYIAVSLITAALICAGAYIESPVMSFSFLARQSYPVYLLHVPLGGFIIGRFEGAGTMQEPIANLIYDLCVFLLVSMVSWYVHEWVEQPGIIFGKRLVTKLQQAHGMDTNHN